MEAQVNENNGMNGVKLLLLSQWRRQNLVRGGTKLREYFLLDRQPLGVERQSLCGCEVT